MEEKKTRGQTTAAVHCTQNWFHKTEDIYETKRKNSESLSFLNDRNQQPPEKIFKNHQAQKPLCPLAWLFLEKQNTPTQKHHNPKHPHPGRSHDGLLRKDRDQGLSRIWKS